MVDNTDRPRKPRNPGSGKRRRATGQRPPRPAASRQEAAIPVSGERGVSGQRQFVAALIAAGLFMGGGYLWSLRKPEHSVSIAETTVVPDNTFDELLELADKSTENQPDDPQYPQNNFAAGSAGTANYDNANPFDTFEADAQPAETRTVSASSPPAATSAADYGTSTFGANDGFATESTDPSFGSPPPQQSSGSNPFTTPDSGPALQGPAMGVPSAAVPTPRTPVTPVSQSSGGGLMIVPGAYHNN